MTRKMWLVVAGAGVATAAAIGAAVPAVANGLAAVVDPATTVYYGGQNGRAADRPGAGADHSTTASVGGYGRNEAGATGQVEQHAADAGTCETCSALPGSGDLAALGDLGAADLQTWVEEEKVAFDLYTAFADQYGVTQFERIAASEANHIEAVRTLLATYGLTDPSAGAAPGEFTDPELADLYQTLLAQGSASLDDALAVGRAVELDDISLLERATADVTAVDVQRVLAQQLSASERHLAAFGG